MCGHKRLQGVENNCSRRCEAMETQWPSGMQNFAYLQKESKVAVFFCPAAKILPTIWPPFRGPEMDLKTGAKSSGHKQNKVRLKEWPPFWGPFLDPKTGVLLSAKFLVTGRKIARVSIVSAGARQKFSTPLGFHGFAAPHLFSTPCEHLCPHMFLTGKALCGETGFLLEFLDWCPEKSLFSMIEGAKSLENL